MSEGIWYYGDHSEEDVAAVHPSDACHFCKTPLLKDEEEAYLLRECPPFRLIARAVGYGGTSIDTSAAVCPCCGWWKYTRFFDFMTPAGVEAIHDGWFGKLKLLDLKDLKTPCGEVQQFLAAKYEDRFDIHPRKFEEVVGAVFSNLGYDTRVTGYSNDGGIDVVLDGPEDSLIGVQVKRYRNSIEVSQIRELTGALVLHGMTRGMFVTTSDFQAGAKGTVNLASVRGIEIELVNAEAFFDALRLSRVSSYVESPREIPWQGFREQLAKVIESEMEERRSREEHTNNDLMRLGREIHHIEDQSLIGRLRARPRQSKPNNAVNRSGEQRENSN
ncbi:hypothetical protein C7B61_15765 [filamentous cyanobacterium CCP1]|nr:hypothetical protein C7B61_15765 [filamentous cyanobacterium CCP1]